MTDPIHFRFILNVFTILFSDALSSGTFSSNIPMTNLLPPRLAFHVITCQAKQKQKNLPRANYPGRAALSSSVEILLQRDPSVLPKRMIRDHEDAAAVCLTTTTLGLDCCRCWTVDVANSDWANWPTSTWISCGGFGSVGRVVSARGASCWCWCCRKSV